MRAPRRSFHPLTRAEPLGLLARGRRDRALLLLGFVGALGRSVVQPPDHQRATAIVDASLWRHADPASRPGSWITRPLSKTFFARAVSQPASQQSLTVDGCRILTRQFRESVEMRQARAAALVGQSLACPLDLHILLPMLPAILLLGPSHPTALF